MVTIDKIRKPIDADLAEFDTFVRGCFKAEDEPLSQIVEYILSSRGKGIRPILTMLAAGLASPERGIGRRTHLAAMMVEMIHVASLVHDDVIDASDTRRGKPSVNALWQSKNAVLAGDWLLARNVEIGLSSGQYDIVSHVVKAITALCSGEIMQGDHARKCDTSREDYMAIIRKKTASLMAISASAGALSAGASSAVTGKLHLFGESLGIAFQIGDDILDYTAQSSVTGKPSNGDLREGKITLPLIEVLERSDEEHRRELLAALAECGDDESKVAYVRGCVEREGGIEAAREVMKASLQRALSVLADFPPSPYRDSLTELCTYIAEREK